MNKSRVVYVTTVFVAAISGFAEAPPNHIDLSKFPATQLDDVVVPLPSEVFNVLDKLGTPNWQGELREPIIKNRGERTQIALQLGSVVAEGFVAVEAADKGRVQEIGRDVLELARAIGVESTVLSRTNSIITKADAGNWIAVRRELDGALTDVKNAMIELKDAQLAHLVSLGGWLRGTEVLTSVVQKSLFPGWSGFTEPTRSSEVFPGAPGRDAAPDAKQSISGQNPKRARRNFPSDQPKDHARFGKKNQRNYRPDG